MWNALGRINKNLIIAIPIMMAAGFIFGLSINAAFLKSLIVPFTFLMVYPMMVTLKIRKVFEGGDGRAQLIAQAINFGLIPFLAYWLGQYFFEGEPYLALGLLLAGLVPTSGMTISWTGFAKGNVEAAVKMTVVGLTLGALLTPVYIKYFLGAALEMDFMAVASQIFLIVFLPMGLGYLTQNRLIKRFGREGFQKRWAPKFPGLSTVGVLAIVFIAMALKARAIYNSPGLLIMILIPLAVLYFVNYVIAAVLGRWFLSTEDGVAVIYGTVMRNLSIAMAVAINAFGSQGSSAALVLAVAYILQVQSAAWSVKYIKRVLGKTERIQGAMEPLTERE